MLHVPAVVDDLVIKLMDKSLGLVVPAVQRKTAEATDAAAQKTIDTLAAKVLANIPTGIQKTFATIVKGAYSQVIHQVLPQGDAKEALNAQIAESLKWSGTHQE